MTIYFEKSLQDIIISYVNTRYWNVYKEYRNSIEFMDMSIHERFEYMIKEFGASDFAAFLQDYENKYIESTE